MEWSKLTGKEGKVTLWGLLGAFVVAFEPKRKGNITVSTHTNPNHYVEAVVFATHLQCLHLTPKIMFF